MFSSPYKTKLKTNDGSRRIKPLHILAPIAGLVLLGLASYPFIRKQAVALTLTSPFLSELPAGQPIGLGVGDGLHVTATNAKGGICHLSATVTQNASVASLNLDEPLKSINPALNKSSVKEANADLPLAFGDIRSQGFQEGPAVLHLEATNCALWSRKTILTQNVALDLSPPILALTSQQLYLHQGGAGVVTYDVSPDTVASEVTVGPYSFKGYAVPGTKNEEGKRFAFFVFSYELPLATEIHVVAHDLAGNSTSTVVTPARIFTSEFRRRDLPITDDFISAKVRTIIQNTPGLKSTGNPLDDFLLVNRTLRQQDNQFLAKLADQTDKKFFWKDAFLPLINSAVEANFADYRDYYYNGTKVDTQVHLGFDLAALEHYPIKVAANGRVVFAAYLGIYGNTIVVDHGYGLMTLYGHLSQMDKKVGDMVTRGDVIAKSGATGLAGGDHLHFSMLIQGVQTNPVEFWDQHWVKDNVYLRLNPEMFGQL